MRDMAIGFGLVMVSYIGSGIFGYIGFMGYSFRDV
jgi:hypothetical protein